jgi:uncharacterized membrane protein
MIKKNLKTLIITSIVILTPIIIGLILWNQLPDEIPFHWNIKGEVDDWASKPVAIFALPAFLLAMQWLCVIATSADPKKHNHTAKPLTLVFWIVPALSVVLSAVMYASALGTVVHVDTIMYILLGLMFIVIGNYMPKCKQSYTLGIKLPWTLDDEENWNKTHRLAGFLWVIGGVVIMASAFLGKFWLFFVVLVPMVIIPTIYSYILYRNKKNK